MRRALPGAILVTLAASAALADPKPAPKPDYVAKGEAARAVSRQVRHHDVSPFAALDELGSLGRAWSSSSFYALRDGAGGHRWVVRRAWGNLSGAGGLTWADSRTCPAVAAMLKGMEALTLRPDVPGLGVDDLKGAFDRPGPLRVLELSGGQRRRRLDPGARRHRRRRLAPGALVERRRPGTQAVLDRAGAGLSDEGVRYRP